MKTNARLFSIGFLVIGLVDGIGLTTIAQPVCHSGKAKPQLPTEEILAKASGFRVIGDACTALTSADGVTWNRRPSPSETNCDGATCGGGLIVKVGPSNVIRTSIDGVAWTKRRACIPASLYAVAYGNSLFVAVGNEGAVVTSADGIEWTSQDSGTEERLRGIAYGEGIFVAVGYSGTIISSKDGVRWTSRKSGTGNRLQSIAYGNGTFVAVGWNGVILTSRSGHTWIRRNSGTSSHLWSVAYTEGDLVLPTLGGCMPTGSQRAGRRMNEPFLSSTHTLRIPSLQKKRRGGERLAKILRTTLYMINTSLIGTEAVSVIPPDLMQGVAKRDCHSPPNYLQVSSVPGFFVCLHGWLGVSPAQIRNRLIKT